MTVKEFIDGIPLTWTCGVCKRTWDNVPRGPQPYAFHTRVNKKSGFRAKGHDICESCYKKGEKK